MADTNNKTLEELIKEGKLAARIQLKHNTKSDWEASNFIPLKGEMVLYDIDPADKKSVLKLKIGDGVRQQDGSVSGTKVDDLPFATISPLEVKTLLDSYATQADLKDAIGGIEKPDLTPYAKTKFVEDNYTTTEELTSLLEDKQDAIDKATAYTDEELAKKADKSDVYTKTEIDDSFSSIEASIEKIEEELSTALYILDGEYKMNTTVNTDKLKDSEIYAWYTIDGVDFYAMGFNNDGSIYGISAEDDESQTLYTTADGWVNSNITFDEYECDPEFDESDLWFYEFITENSDPSTGRREISVNKLDVLAEELDRLEGVDYEMQEAIYVAEESIIKLEEKTTPYEVGIAAPESYSRENGVVEVEVLGGTYNEVEAAFQAGRSVFATYVEEGGAQITQIPLVSIDISSRRATFAAEISDGMNYLILTLSGNSQATMEMSASHGELSQGLDYTSNQISEHAEAIEELQKETQPLSRGGTGATTATKALDNLGITDRLSALEQLLNSLSPSVTVRVPYSYGDWDYHNDSYTCLITCKLDDFPTGAKNLAKYCTKCAIKNADEIRSFFSGSTGSDNKNYIFAGKIVDATKLVIYLEYPGDTGKEPSIPMTSDTQYAELELSGLNLTRNTSSQLD